MVMMVDGPRSPIVNRIAGTGAPLLQHPMTPSPAPPVSTLPVGKPTMPTPITGVPATTMPVGPKMPKTNQALGLLGMGMPHRSIY